jgi:hypothetical protein
VIEAVGQADAFEEFAGALFDGGGGAGMGGEGWDEHVFENGAVGEQMVGLEDEPDSFPSELRVGFVVGAVEGNPIEQDLAGVGLIEGACEIQEGALAGAGRSDDGDRLAVFEREGRIAQDDDGGCVRGGAVGLGDATQDEERFRHGGRVPRMRKSVHRSDGRVTVHR